MTIKRGPLDHLLLQDVDDVVAHAPSLTGKERTAALRASLVVLETSSNDLDRLKILLFIQSVLAAAADGKLASSVAESIATELARVVMSGSDPVELKIPALDGLALVFLKAKELSTNADARVRDAFHSASRSSNAQLSEFGQRAFSNKGILAQRVVQKQYRYVKVSVTAVAATAFTGAGVFAAKGALKKYKDLKLARRARANSKSA